MAPRLDTVVPVYNEGNIILATLAELRARVSTPFRILICYDRPDDDTLSTIWSNPDKVEGLAIEIVRNPSRGGTEIEREGISRSKLGKCRRQIHNDARLNAVDHDRAIEVQCSRP